MEVLMHEASKGPDENENSTCTTYLEESRKNEEMEIKDKSPQITLIKKEDYMDITFENITYNVSLGFRKGIYIVFSIFSNFYFTNFQLFRIFIYFILLSNYQTNCFF